MAGVVLGAVGMSIRHRSMTATPLPVRDARTAPPGPEPEPQSDTAPELEGSAPQLRPAKASVVARLVACVLGWLLLAGGLLIGYVKYGEVTAVPEPQREAGSVLLYFDRPGVEARLEVRVDERRTGFGESRYFINVSKSGESGELGFMFVATGAGRATEVYPAGTARDTVNGCWDSIDGFYGLVPRCHDTRMPPGPGYSTSDALVESQVITGTIRRDADGQMMTEVWLWSDDDFIEKGGKRTYFSLPKVGTSYLPPGYRAGIPYGKPGEPKTYVPEKLDVTLIYRDLSSRDRVESVSPEPALPGKLAWAEADASSIAPRGSIVDMVVEDQNQNLIFLIGAFLGVASTLLPILAVQSRKLAEDLIVLVRTRVPTMPGRDDGRRDPAP